MIFLPFCVKISLAYEVCVLLCFAFFAFLFSSRSFLVNGFSFFGIYIPGWYSMYFCALIIFERLNSEMSAVSFKDLDFAVKRFKFQELRVTVGFVNG